MSTLTGARAAFRREAWRDACAGFLAERPSLGAADLERLAVSAYLVGRSTDSDQAWESAYRRHQAEGEVAGATRCLFWLAFRLLNSAERPTANAWIARLERLVADTAESSPERARLDYLTGLRAALNAELDAAASDLERAAESASRRGDEELAALARLSLGRVRIFAGQVTTGVRLLDDAMLVVGSESMSPIAVGDSYCTAIEACRDLVDIRRGRSWTEQLTRWCQRQPDLVPFAGVCQVHRSEFLQLKGAWVEALEQAMLARERLACPDRQLAYGAAVYQQGEVHRVRGEFDQAELCYRDASAAGRDPQPGLALLRLSLGRAEDAARAIQRALSEAGEGAARSAVLAAAVQIMLAVNSLPAATAAAEELATAAVALESPMLQATARRAAGWVSLADGQPHRALTDLRWASDGFRELQAPYEVACTALLIGSARRTMGDAEGASLEFDVARTTFESLGARFDVTRVPGRATGGLTARELQVLRLVAHGATNRSIGAELGLSERTVDRHLSNIFAKLGVSSRAAATARALHADLL